MGASRKGWVNHEGSARWLYTRQWNWLPSKPTVSGAVAMTSTFDEYRFDDATITKLVIEDTVARLTVRNWRDEIDVLVFDDVAGMESLSFINAALSHGEDLKDDEFLQRCCAAGEEQANEFHCFQFFSAWSESPILRIVARSFNVFAPNVQPSA